MLQKSAPFTVRYGNSLNFAGAHVPEPSRIDVPTRHGMVGCQVYRSSWATCTAPVYVHFHGGAFVMRYPEMDDFFARYLVAAVGAVVVNVDYDVAPQVRYPVAQEQAHDVVAWVASHGDEIGCDASRLAVGGFSAGGNLAASAVVQARQSGAFKASLQLLGVPSLDVAEDIETKCARAPQAMITPGLLGLVRSTYFTDPDRLTEPVASPLLAPDLDGLPPALVVTAEHDVLRLEGDRYVERLRAAGVPVEHRVVPGVDHYFLEGPPTQARQIMNLMAGGLHAALAA